MTFSAGFTMEGKVYGWHEKQLYRLPYTKGTKSFALRKMSPGRIGVTTVYFVGGKKRTIGSMISISSDLIPPVEIFTHPDMP